MPATVVLVDYLVELETGERMEVAELDPERVPELRDPAVLAAAAPVLDRCTRMPRRVLESAKVGHSREFEALLGTPPIGCLLKLERPVCAEIDVCATADRAKCTTRYVAPRRHGAIGMFPPCWEFEVGEADPVTAARARALAASVVPLYGDQRFWRPPFVLLLVIYWLFREPQPLAAGALAPTQH